MWFGAQCFTNTIVHCFFLQNFKTNTGASTEDTVDVTFQKLWKTCADLEGVIGGPYPPPPPPPLENHKLHGFL